MSIRMELARILIRETEDTHIVELREAEGQRVFPIVIGLNEAGAIERRLLGQEPPRPQTHELLADVIEKVGFKLDKVVINDLRDHTFFAQVHLSNGDRRVEIDSRPSDAIALGVAGNTPIFVEERVLDEVDRGEQ